MLSEPATTELFNTKTEADCIDVKGSFPDVWKRLHGKLLEHLKDTVPIDPWLHSIAN